MLVECQFLLFLMIFNFLIKTLFYVAILGSQRNWVKSTEFLYIPSSPLLPLPLHQHLTMCDTFFLIAKLNIDTSIINQIP